MAALNFTFTACVLRPQNSPSHTNSSNTLLMSKYSTTLASPLMTYFSYLEARQTEQRARYITHPLTHTHTYTTHHLLLWISSHERPKNLLLWLLGTIRVGISYMCLCGCTCLCACVYAHVRLCLHETLSLSRHWPWAIWSCGLCCGVPDTCQCRPSPLSHQPEGPLKLLTDGNIQILSCMSLLLRPSICAHLEVFSCTLVIC